MAQSFKETAHLKTDLNKYGENYDRIFGKKEPLKECICDHEYGEYQTCDFCQGITGQETDQESK